MKYIDWQISETRFLAMTGYKLFEFNELLPYFEQAHNDYLSRYCLKGKPRSGQREHVIYANSPLPCIEERLAFALSYKKLNPIQEQHADTFSITQSQCNKFVHGLKEILSRALLLADVMPARNDRELQELLQREEHCDKKLLLHDGSEREIPRPVDNDLQKEMYSGKKKKHTVKNAFIVAACCLILFVSRTFSGKVHDKTIADTQYSIPPGYTIVQDTGYQGYNPEGVIVIQPKKKPRGKDLTKEEKESNSHISSFRVRVEHAIGSVKRYRIVKDECRLRKNNYVDDVIHICAGLHNFRLKTKPFNYENKLI
jgi:hypothetical protein